SGNRLTVGRQSSRLTTYFIDFQTLRIAQPYHPGASPCRTTISPTTSFPPGISPSTPLAVWSGRFSSPHTFLWPVGRIPDDTFTWPYGFPVVPTPVSTKPPSTSAPTRGPR